MEQDLILRQERRCQYPIMPSLEINTLPSNLQKYMQYAGQFMFRIKTYDRKKYEVKVEAIKVKSHLLKFILPTPFFFLASST